MPLRSFLIQHSVSAVFAPYWISFLQLDLGVAFTAKILSCGFDEGGCLRLKSGRDVGFARHG